MAKLLRRAWALFLRRCIRSAALAGLLASAAHAQPAVVDCARENYSGGILEIRTKFAGSTIPRIGSAFVVSKGGHVITALHNLVENSRAVESVMVRFAGGTEQPATVLKPGVLPTESAMSDVADVAILLLSKPPANVVPLPLAADTRDLQLNDAVFAYGNKDGSLDLKGPAGLGQRDVILGGQRRALYKAQSTFSSGMSGGPVFNAQGKVVGIVAQRIEDDGGGYFVPIDEAIKLLPAGVTHGVASRCDDADKPGFSLQTLSRVKLGFQKEAVAQKFGVPDSTDEPYFDEKTKQEDWTYTDGGQRVMLSFYDGKLGSLRVYLCAKCPPRNLDVLALFDFIGGRSTIPSWKVLRLLEDYSISTKTFTLADVFRPFGDVWRADGVVELEGGGIVPVPGVHCSYMSNVGAQVGESYGITMGQFTERIVELARYEGFYIAVGGRAGWPEEMGLNDSGDSRDGDPEVMKKCEAFAASEFEASEDGEGYFEVGLSRLRE